MGFRIWSHLKNCYSEKAANHQQPHAVPLNSLDHVSKHFYIFVRRAFYAHFYEASIGEMQRNEEAK